MTTTNTPPAPNKPPNKSNALTNATRKAGSIFAAAGHSAASITKTHLLRKGRVRPFQHKQRLDVCRNCPGGHAKFKKNGELHTCGPMLKSLVDEGNKTCGCVLIRKAWDFKEKCPFGYWPEVKEPAPSAVPSPDTPAVTAKTQRAGILRPSNAIIRPSKRIITPANHNVVQTPEPLGVVGPPSNLVDIPTGAGTPISRRNFIGKTAAAVTAATFGQRAFGAEQLGVPVNRCNCSEVEYVLCSVANNHSTNHYFKTSDGKCYELTHSTEVIPPGKTPLTPDQWFASCTACDKCYELDPCDLGGTSIKTYDDLASYVGDFVEVEGACYEVLDSSNDCCDADPPGSVQIDSTHATCTACETVPCECSNPAIIKPPKVWVKPVPCSAIVGMQCEISIIPTPAAESGPGTGPVGLGGFFNTPSGCFWANDEGVDGCLEFNNIPGGPWFQIELYDDGNDCYWRLVFSMHAMPSNEYRKYVGSSPVGTYTLHSFGAGCNGNFPPVVEVRDVSF